MLRWRFQPSARPVHPSRRPSIECHKKLLQTSIGTRGHLGRVFSWLPGNITCILSSATRELASASTRGIQDQVGVGLMGMEERVRELGGRLSFRHAANGTSLTISLPRQKRMVFVPILGAA